MPQLECRLGTFRRGTSVPAPLALGGRPIESFVHDAARDVDGHPLVDLHLNAAYLPTPYTEDGVNKTPTSAYELHGALRKLIEIRPSLKGLRHRIGLIFADRWEGSATVFGMMFDVGFKAQELGAVGLYNDVAREGCAVFVDAIRDVRGEEGFAEALIDHQIAWTSLHELGHVLNLWHLEDPIRFMTSSRREEIFQPGQNPSVDFSYHDVHRDFLAKTLAGGLVDEKAMYSWPGGKAFGDRGEHVPGNIDFYHVMDRPRSRSALELRVGISQEEFWSFEPVELDIEIRVPAGIKKRYVLPAQIDPGYRTFDLWIEEPDGSRRSYRSPRHYCQNLGTVKVTAAQPFRRDLSLFGQSGGYTFRQAGPHRLYATWLLPDGSVVESNHLEFLVRSSLGRSAEYEERRKILTEPGIALLLYHREGDFRNRWIAPLEDLAGKTDDVHLRGNLDYAVGRFLHKAGAGRSRQTRQAHHARARGHLLRALDLGDTLSPRRAYHAARICEEIEQG